MKNQLPRGEGAPGLEEGRCADSKTLALLELPELLAQISSLAQSPQGASAVKRLAPCADPAVVTRRLDRLSELCGLLLQTNPPNLQGLEGIKPLLNRLEVDGAILIPEELETMASFLGAVSAAASFLEQAGRELPELYRLGNLVTPLPELRKRLLQVVGPGHSVSSNASSLLGSLRREMHQNRDRLRARLQEVISRPELAGIFSDQVITQRADRFVVPVKTNAKGRLSGIIHDTSGSGSTCFLEPLEAVEDNNQLALLRRREREEEYRVLAEVARELALNLQVLGEDLRALGKLDCLLAQAEFCRRVEAIRPRLGQNGQIELHRARHPLLAWRAGAGRGRAVPIELLVGPEQEALVISGANAGGKTVALKTVGLLTLMTMCGIHVPCQEGSLISLFEQVLCEMGDEQDLDRELSTFTAHAGRLYWMLSQARKGTLLLIDELGGGTDPEEGSALGMALLEEYISRGSRVLCTTHFHRLKAFASQTPGVQNVSVAFDQKSRRPTYQLHYGTPGFSDALAVSRQLGFPPRLIDRAEGLLDQSERQTVAFLQKAQQAWQEASAQRDAARSQYLAAKQDRREAKDLMAAARRERAGALAEGKRRVRQVAQRLQERLEELWQKVQEAQQGGEPPKPGQVRQELYGARRQALTQVSEVLETCSQDNLCRDLEKLGLKKGDPVRLTGLGSTGVLLETPREGMETVAVSVGVQGVRVLVPLLEIEALPQGAVTPPKPGGVSVQAQAPDGLDLKIIGLTVDEAIPLVDKALDQAILSGKASLRVVHGVGTGRLGAAVRDYLKSHPQVAAARNEEARRGGVGVTVVDLRD